MEVKYEKTSKKSARNYSYDGGGATIRSSGDILRRHPVAHNGPQNSQGMAVWTHRYVS